MVVWGGLEVVVVVGFVVGRGVAAFWAFLG